MKYSTLQQRESTSYRVIPTNRITHHNKYSMSTELSFFIRYFTYCLIKSNHGLNFLSKHATNPPVIFVYRD